MPAATDNDSIRELEPKSLWSFFADLNAIPRASKKEERVIEFAKQFGESRGLSTEVDRAGNVRIRKPATAGMELRAPIVMQSHLDMVHQKNSDTNFDFDTQGIEMVIDGDWVKARGTTLGADNGIGVATIMAVLASKEIAHPPLEALFTIDEETGMTGAKELQPGWLQGKYLLNLDTEEDNELTIGCAGGADVSCTLEYPPQPTLEDSQAFQISIRGLRGGHSGMDIHLGLGNANKLMNQLLKEALKAGGQIASIDGGGLRNAIPRESTAIVCLPASANTDSIEELAGQMKTDWSETEPEIEIQIQSATLPASIYPTDQATELLNMIEQIPNGVETMSEDIPGMVQTSNNLARVILSEGQFRVDCLTRSNADPDRTELTDRIRDIMHAITKNVTISGEYPAWPPKPGSKIVDLMRGIYRAKFDDDPHVSACHAGLECGLLGQHYPEMEMISFGPTIRGAHSPDERVCISSVQKYWSYLVETLQQIPE